MKAIGQRRRPLKGLLALAAIPFSRPEPGSVVSAAVLGTAGLSLSGGSLVMLLRRAPLPGLLAVHGVCVALVGLFLAIHSLAWSLHAPSLDRFRYAPGLTMILMMYGLLQLAAFGPVSRAFAAPLRIAGLLAGVACELAVAICLLVLALRA